MGFTLTFGTTIGASAPTWSWLQRQERVASGADLLAGNTTDPDQGLRALVVNDRLIRAQRMRCVFSIYGTTIGAGVLDTTSSSYVDIGQCSHIPSVGTSGEYIIQYYLTHSGGTSSDLLVSIDDGVSGPSTTTIQQVGAGSTEGYYHWTPGYSVTAGTAQRILVQLRATGGGTATLTGITIWERDLESGDL